MTEDSYAPSFVIYVDGEKVKEDYSHYVSRLVYDEQTDLTAKIEIDFNNAVALNYNQAFADERIFHPGHEIEIWFGYGNELEYIARGEIIRHSPRFQAVKTVQVVAYDRSWRMKKEDLVLQSTENGPQRETKTSFEGMVGDFITGLARKYGMKADISDGYAIRPVKFIQRKGQNDYQLLQSLSNYYYATFKVEYRVDDGWYIVFRDIYVDPTQLFRYTLTYFDGPASCIETISFEYSVEELIGEAKVYYWDATATKASVSSPASKKTTRINVGEWLELSEEPFRRSEVVQAETAENAVKGKGAPTPKTAEEKAAAASAPPKKYTSKDPFLGGSDSKLAKGSTSPTPILLRLVIGGHSVEIASRPFKDADDARQFVKSWIAQNRDNFIIATGTMVGLKIRAGESHFIEGPDLGDTYSGLYYFVRVQQVFDTGSTAWQTEFVAHRVIIGDVDTTAQVPSIIPKSTITFGVVTEEVRK